MSPIIIALFLAVVLFFVIPTIVHGRNRRYAAGQKNQKQKTAGSHRTPAHAHSSSQDRPTPAANTSSRSPAAASPVNAEFRTEAEHTTFPANALFGSLDNSPFAKDKLADLTRPLDNKREEQRTMNLFELDKKDDLTRSFLD
jgi:hypothetical protein